MNGLGEWALFAAILAALAAPPLWALPPAFRSRRRAEAAALALPLGLALFALSAHPLFLGGISVALPGAMAVYLLVWLACAFLRRIPMKAIEPAPPLRSEQEILLLYAAAFLAFALCAFSSFTLPFYDSLVYWTAKGLVFADARDARIFPWTHGPTYPLAIPFLHSLFLLFESVVGAISWARAFCFASLLFGLIASTRRHGWGGLLAGVALLPALVMTLDQGGIGFGLYADGTLGAALYLSAALLMEILDGRRELAWPAAAALSFAALTKVNAAGYIPIIALAFAIALPRRSEGGAALVAGVFGPVALALAAWKALLWWKGVGGGVEGVAGDVLARDILSSSAPVAVYAHKLRLSLAALSEIFSLDRPWSPDFFRRLGWTILLPFLALPAWRALRPRERFAALSASGVFAFVIGAMYCLVHADDDSESAWWFRTGLYRAAIHALPIATLFVHELLARLLADAFPRPLPQAALSTKALWAARLAPIAMAVAILAHAKGSSNWSIIFMGYGASQGQEGPCDRYGLYEPESWGVGRVRWTSSRVRLPVLRRGARLKIRYSLGRPDISPESPVDVVIGIEGLPPVRQAHDAPGVYEREFDVSPLPGPYLPLDFSVSRPWITPEGRSVGAALFPFEWPNSP